MVNLNPEIVRVLGFQNFSALVDCLIETATNRQGKSHYVRYLADLDTYQLIAILVEDAHNFQPLK